MLETLRTIAWIVGIVYATIPSFWLVVHPTAAWWGNRHRSPLKVLGLVWLAMWIVVGVLTNPWRDILLYDTPWAWAFAIPLLAAGVYVYGQAKRDFTADQVLGRSELHPHKHEQRLVTGGIRERVRHPIYLGHLLELIAWTLGSGMVVLYGMTVYAIVTGWIMLDWEDGELEQRFGEEYREYRRRVPAIFPRLR